MPRTAKKARPSTPKGTKAKGKKKEKSQQEPIFEAEAVVAVPAKDPQKPFLLVKLLDDVYDNSDDVPVIILEKSKGKKNIYHETDKDSISYHDIIGEAPVATIEYTGKKGNQTASYEFSNSSLEKLKTITKNFIKKAENKSDEEDDDEEDEEEEDEDEEDEEETPAKKKASQRKPAKKVVGKKTPKSESKSGKKSQAKKSRKKDEMEEEDEDEQEDEDVEGEEDEEEEEEEDIGGKSSKGNKKVPAKKKAPKKQSAKKRKDIEEEEDDDDEDDEEEEEEEEDEDDEEEEQPKGKRGRVAQKDKKSTGKATKSVEKDKKSTAKETKSKSVLKDKKTASKDSKRKSASKDKKSTPKAKKPKGKADEEEEESEEEEVEEEEEEEEEKPKRAAKKQKQSGKKAKATKKVDIDEEEEEEEEEEEDEEEEAPVKKSKKKTEKEDKKKEKKDKNDKKEKEKKGKKDKKEKEKKEKKENKEKEKKKKNPEKYKKGKFNPNVKTIETCEMLEGTSNNIIDYGSVKENNKNIIRAAYTTNHKLLKEILSINNKVSSHHDKWGPENDITALELFFRNKDKKGLKMLVDNYNAHQKGKSAQHMAFDPPVGLRQIDTGYNSIYTFGVRVRKVAMGRGGRQGNNAFVEDLAETSLFDDRPISKIVEHADIDLEMIDLLRAHVDEFERIADGAIPDAVRSGNYKLAGHLISNNIKKGGWGFNFLHDQVLNLKDPKKLQTFKKVSVTKKTFGGSVITPIHCAAINPNSKFLEALLEAAPEFSIADEKLRKPVHYAAACEGPGPLELLLSKGVDSREGDQTKLTPLMVAANYGRTKNLDILLTGEGRSIINAKNKDGMMAIHLAAMNGHLDAVKKLVAKGSDVNAPGRFRMQPLHFAAAYGHFDIVKYLLEKGGKILGKDKFKRNPVVLAVRNGNLKIASYLLANGGDFNQPDSSKNYAIHYAAAYAFPECVEVLVKAGADQNVKNDWNLTPLTVAMLKNNFGCVKELLKYEKTDVDCKDDQGKTLIAAAIENLSRNTYSQIKFLIKEKHADPNVPDMQGNTPLHHACRLHSNKVESLYQWQTWQRMSEKQKEKATQDYKELILEAVRLLIDCGSDVNARNAAGESPFQIALESRNFDIIEILLQQKDLELGFHDNEDRGIYHLISSVISEKEGVELFHKIVKLVGNNNDLLNLVDSGGFTPLHSCVIEFGSANGASQYLQNTYENLKAEALKKKQEEWEKEHKKEKPSAKDIGAEDKKKGKGKTKATKKGQKSKKRGSDDEEDHDEEEDHMDEEEDEEIEIEEDHEEDFDEDGNEDDGALSGAFAGFGSSQKRNKFGQPMRGNRHRRGGSSHISLTADELKKIEGQAEEELNIYVNKFIQILEEMISNGAKPDVTVDKLKKFRQKPAHENKDDKHDKHNQGKKDSVMAEEKEDEEKSSSGLRGGARTKYTARKVPKKVFASWRQESGDSVDHGPRAIGDSFWSSTDHETHEVHGRNKKPREYGPNGLQGLVHLATDYPHPTLIKYLLNLNPDHINVQDSRKRTPLNLAVGKLGDSLAFSLKSTDMIELFLNHKADPNIPDEHQNYPVFVAASQEKYEFIPLLKKYNANLNVVNSRGQTPLIHAVESGKHGAVEDLLNAGADPNFRDSKNRTALHHAVNVSTTSADASFEMENLLIRHKTDVNAVDNRGRTPLHYAFVKIGHPTDKSHIDPIEAVTSLCGIKGCRVDVKDNWGSTPMHYAAQRGAHICALSLLNKKADIETKDQDGNTPLAIALLAGHSNVAIMLIQSKANVLNKVHVVKRKMNTKDKDKEKKKDGNKMEVEGKDKKEKKAPKLKSQEEIAGDMIGEPAEEEEDNEDMDVEKDGSKHGSDPTDEEKSSQGSDEDEEEEDEDDHGYGGYKHPRHARGKVVYGRHFGHHHHRKQSIGHSSKNYFILDDSLEEGTYSMFCIAIRRGWQGVAYLMLQNNFPLMNALQDALNEEKFMYVRTLLNKVEDPGVVRNANEEGRNLFHTFSMKGHGADHELTVKIFKELVHYGVGLKAVDKRGRTPLHYACESHFVFMIDELLKAGVDPSIQDEDGHTGFSLLLVSKGLNKELAEKLVKHGADLNKKFKIKTQHKEVRIGPLAYLCQQGIKDFDLYNTLLKNGVSINDADEEGVSALMYAIKENSKKMVKFFTEHSDIDKNMADKSGKTPVHYVVNPLEYGSYENITILEMVAKVFDVNAKDKLDHAPIFYAHLQDSGRMVEKLRELGATDQRPGIQRQPTSIISAMGWPDQELDVEEDAEKFIQQKQAEKDGKEAEKPHLIEPDEHVNNAENCEVVYDPKLGPYNLIMTKVDIKQGGYSENVFYRMQVLHEKNRSVYILFTRWGRIGEDGAYQQTPFATKEECISNFCKIFKDKAGNLWENKDKFEKQKKKYQLLRFERRVNHKEFIKPFDLKDPSLPKTSLNKEVRTIMEGITSVKMYQKAFDNYHIDREYLPLEQLSKKILSEAKAILFEISELIEELEQRRSDKKKTHSNDEILRIREEIADKSSRYYELIPNSQYRDTAIPPINTSNQLKNHTDIIDSLLDFEIAIKTILGSMHRIKEVHPLEYCYSALNVKMMPLDKDSAEFQVLRQYIKSGHEGFNDDFIINIFAVERKGEAERFAKWKDLKNHMLLWHGSKISNFMGILSQGLRIAPPEAPSTGYMFGKGVYFSDVFDKSFGYTSDYTVDQDKNYALLLLCEVALGEIRELKEPEYVTEPKAPYKSVKGLGNKGPKLKQGIVLSNGAVVPCGDVIEYKRDDEDDDYWSGLEYNEYIVYDVSQIRTRYLVQVKKSDNDYY